MSDRGKANWRAVALGVATVIAAGVALLGSEEPAEVTSESFSPSTLFHEPARCRPAPNETPAHRAVTAEGDALAKMQRYPFAPREGPEAVALLAEAVHCKRGSGDVRGADDLRDRLEQFRAQVWHDVLVRRLRLERALEGEQLQPALTEVQALRELWNERDSEFGSWLWERQVDLESALANPEAQ